MSPVTTAIIEPASCFCDINRFIDGFPISPPVINAKSHSTKATNALRQLLNSNSGQPAPCINIFIREGLEDRLKVVRANISQSDKQFADETRGNQGTAIAMVAVAYAELHPPHTWTPKIMDNLIIVGDKTHAKAKTKETLLTLDEVPSDIALDDTDYHIELGYDNYVEDDFNVVHLIAGFQNFFGSSTTKGVLWARGCFISFYMEEDEVTQAKRYYTFDSLPRDANGLNYDRNDGTAVLVEYKSIEDMAELIVRNINGVNKWQKLDDFKTTFSRNRKVKLDGYHDMYALTPFKVTINTPKKIDTGSSDAVEEKIEH